MNEIDGWRKRANSLDDDELISIFAVNSKDYRPVYLALVRDELSRRGFSFADDEGEVSIVSPSGIRIKPQPIVPEGEIIDPQLKGVDGWLLLFVIGQLVCRPLVIGGQMLQAYQISSSHVSVIFPVTSILIQVGFAIDTGLMLFGIIVATALLKNTGAPLPVKLAKIFLSANLVVVLLVMFLPSFLALSSEIYNKALEETNFEPLIAAIASVAWLLYFEKSKRVRATYLADQRLDSNRHYWK